MCIGRIIHVLDINVIVSDFVSCHENRSIELHASLTILMLFLSDSQCTCVECQGCVEYIFSPRNVIRQI